jgi:hypothetical protein
MPTRGWLKLGGYMITVCALFSMVIGVYLWVLTLRTKQDFFQIWIAQDARVQDMMQTAFSCCGYFNSTSPAFVTDATCTSPAAAALMRGCSAPISSFSNIFIDDIFTAVFGMVGTYSLSPGEMDGGCRLRGKVSNVAVRCRRCPDPGHGLSPQGPQGTRTIPTHRREEWLPRHLKPYFSPSFLSSDRVGPAIDWLNILRWWTQTLFLRIPSNYLLPHCMEDPAGHSGVESSGVALKDHGASVALLGGIFHSNIAWIFVFLFLSRDLVCVVPASGDFRSESHNLVDKSMIELVYIYCISWDT